MDNLQIFLKKLRIILHFHKVFVAIFADFDDNLNFNFSDFRRCIVVENSSKYRITLSFHDKLPILPENLNFQAERVARGSGRDEAPEAQRERHRRLGDLPDPAAAAALLPAAPLRRPAPAGRRAGRRGAAGRPSGAAS